MQQRNAAAKAGIRILINLFLVVIILYAWLSMIMGPNGLFSSRGMVSLRYFTILSNLLEAAVSIAWICLHRKRRRTAETLKYIAAVSVALTFTTVMVFLGPLFGYAGMFRGPNFWLHLVAPVAAVLEYICMSEERMGRWENLFAVLPMILYGIFYYANNLINGRGVWPDTNDWYGFLTWGYAVGAVIFAVIVLVTYLLGLLIRTGHQKAAGRETLL